MRVIIGLALVALYLMLGGCSHPYQRAYEADPWLPRASKPNSVKPAPVSVRNVGELNKTSAKKRPPLPVRKASLRTPSVVTPPPLPIRKPRPTGVDGQQLVEKFKAAQAKAKLSGIHTLTQEDIDGLSLEQIKELRGY